MNSAAATVRPADQADLAAIEGLLRASGLPAEGVARALADFFVADAGGGIAGVAGVELSGDCGLLRSVAVSPSSRRRGIAAALVERVTAHARRQGCRELYLLTLDAEGYFQRRGYEVTDRGAAPASVRASAEFTTLCPASATLMRKRLAGAGRIVVLNPNSTTAVTESLRDALSPFSVAGGPEIECVTLKAGPPAIETDADVDNVSPRVREFVAANAGAADAFVIACFSDPGVALARRDGHKPVFGMAECGYLTAVTRGERFGVISIIESSIPRHRRAVRDLGVESRLAADLALGLGVLELGDAGVVGARLEEVGLSLTRRHGAGVVLLGCAGLAGYRGTLEAALGVPVIEPVQAAVAMAAGTVLAAKA